MPRTPRRTAAIAVVVVVLLVIVGVVAYLAGRAGQNVAPSTPPTASATAPSGPTSPRYTPTTDEGSPQAGLARGVVSAGQGGTTAGPSNLPLGYPQDENGAVAAATNYLIWMNSIKITDKEQADAMADTAAADASTRSALVQSFDELRTGMESLKADQPEPARGAYAIANYAAGRATIYIWAPEVTTDTDNVTDHLWGVDSVRLVWASGDWKLDGALIAQTGGAAVDPTNPAGNPTAAEKASILSRTPADPGEITDTASQTWTEYANAPG